MIRTLLRLLPNTDRRHMTPYLVFVFFGVVLRAAGALALIPLVTALFSDNPSRAWAPLAALTAATALGWVCDAAAARRSYVLGFALLDHAQHTVATRITEIRLEWFTADNLATTRRAVAATGPELVGLIAYLFTPLMNALLLPILIGLGLLWFSPTLAAAALACVPILLGALWLSLRLTRSADAATEQAHTQLSERLIEFARTQQALRSARQAGSHTSHVGKALTIGHASLARLLAFRAPEQLVFTVLAQLSLIALTVIAVAEALTPGADKVSAATAVALIVVIVRLLEPLTLLAEIATGLQVTTGAVRTIREVLDAPRQAGGDGKLSHPGAPRIELKDVTFGYDNSPNRRVINSLDLTFEAGTTTAIVGPSGSGKSTLLYLVAGLYSPTAGQIRVDGTDLASLPSETRRELMSMVFQEPYLFAGSVLDNMRTGNPDATSRQLNTAAKLARVDTFATTLQDGFATSVGEGGKALSGGQRQRVAIARALVKPAPILLVDEATSALDTENERAVADALSADDTPRTRIIVAHRLSSIQQADRVLFFDEGRIVEDGSVPDLLALKGRFASYWEQHTAASAWRLRSPG